MRTPRHFGTVLCALCFVLNTALAQAQPTTGSQPPAPSVTATATPDRVHFAASGAVTHLHLEVFTTSQEQVYDSGVVAGGTLDWHLSDQHGQRVADGAYPYTMTVTDAAKESRPQRGTITVQGGVATVTRDLTPEPLANQVVDGDIIFTSPGQSSTYARDIKLSDNFGGLRFIGADSLTTTPAGAAIQFFGNNASPFNGQLYLDSGALNTAALIFRTAETGGTITEQMRVTAAGNVGIGTSNPSYKLHVVSSINAVAGVATGFGDGVWGRSSSGLGVRGQSDSSTGVFGSTGSGSGIVNLTENSRVTPLRSVVSALQVS